MAFRVAIVGLGMAVTPHAKSLQDLKVDVAYAHSPSVARRTQFAQKFPFPLCDSLETILKDKTLDAVLILTPPNTHLELVEKFAAAGKHILLEKPLEISIERAERLVKACSKVKLGIVLQHRFRPGAEKLREMLPELGELVSASAAIPNWRPQSYYDMPGRGTRARDGGGVLLTQGIHTLDLFLSFVGDFSKISSFVRTTPVHRMETEDLVAAVVEFKNGAIGTVHATTAAYPGFPERIELIGTKGTALLEGPSLKIALASGKTFEVKAEGGGTGADPMAFPHDWHRDLLADFLEAIEKNRQPRISGEEALKVHRFIDRILRSAG
ncbi:MAG: UDP-N-acetyl-2-amino-2-deoxyglucuronate dehydrogenase [Betaproteobacteria bacterium]|jgi:predicted dehydrogenase|nr:UDP-N-acetyl-2-amino-2-deoxyglucuronate dehydrogenase [Betaproteobacteria bacterium]